MSSRLSRWAWRAGFATFLTVALTIITSRFEFEPDPARLAVLVALTVALVGLVLDSVPDRMPTFDLPTGRYRDTRGADQRTAFFRRLIEANQSAKTPDSTVLRQLTGLADATLRARHGETLGTPRATELLGEDALAVLHSEPRRLTLDEIDLAVTRIEEL